MLDRQNASNTCHESKQSQKAQWSEVHILWSEDGDRSNSCSDDGQRGTKQDDPDSLLNLGRRVDIIGPESRRDALQELD